ncbi:DUF397 domain-containing protein [Bailinhaonella thermotolerans]|uniref:DUF397 domain-containing protein n=1 Tax=Bailinhaonella thermotolerans TaxID=1070861 RepID=A0A3A4ASJ8_9ACTN|nr:DUF397 domain-containing protein [Bailinhaonella thermotolerans]
MDPIHVNWRRSSHSGSGANCVEVAVADRRGLAPSHLVRDSKDPRGGVLSFTPGEWRAFLDKVKHGDATA